MPKNQSVLQKAVDIGLRDREIFDWPDAHGALEKLKEEVIELEEVMIENTSKEKIFAELSDVFLTLLQVARHLKIDPEQNLDFALKKYDTRYQEMFRLIKVDSKNPANLSLEELESYWSQSKKLTQEQVKMILNSYI